MRMGTGVSRPAAADRGRALRAADTVSDTLPACERTDAVPPKLDVEDPHRDASSAHRAVPGLVERSQLDAVRPGPDRRSVDDPEPEEPALRRPKLAQDSALPVDEHHRPRGLVRLKHGGHALVAAVDSRREDTGEDTRRLDRRRRRVDADRVRQHARPPVLPESNAWAVA